MNDRRLLVNGRRGGEEENRVNFGIPPDVWVSENREMGCSPQDPAGERDGSTP